jgi:hypothetical protein
MRILGSWNHPTFRANPIYRNAGQIVCRNLDLVGNQTQSGFTPLESDSTRRE